MLCYRKDDCAMRPIYGCPENFQESLAMPTSTFLKIVNGLLLGYIPLFRHPLFRHPLFWHLCVIR